MARLNSYKLPTNSSLSGVSPSAFETSIKYTFSKTLGVTSSSTSEVALSSILIPANTYGIDTTVNTKLLEVKALVYKTGTNGGATIRLYVNDTDNLNSPTQIGIVTYPVSNGGVPVNHMPIFRRMYIDNPEGSVRGTVVFRTTTSASNDIFFSATGEWSLLGFNSNAGGVSFLPINWGVDNYIIVAGSVVSTSDVIQCQYLKINN